MNAGSINYRDDGSFIPPPQTIWKRKRKGGRESARTEEDSEATQIILSVFRFEREQSNFARVSETAQLFRILLGISPLFSLFPFFSPLFLHTHSPRTAYKRTSPSVQVYVGPRCTLSGMKRENKRKREEKRGNKIKRFVQRNFLMLLRPDALTDQVGTRRTISVDYGGLHR